MCVCACVRVLVSVALLNVFSQKLADRMQVLATVGKTVALSVIIYYGIKNLVEGTSVDLLVYFFYFN